MIVDLVMIAIVLSTSAAKSTLAGWTADDASKGTFTAGTIGTVQNLQCVDSEDLLGTGLLARDVKLTWRGPQDFAGTDLEYVVTWQAVTIGDSGSAVVKSPVNGVFEYKYSPRSFLTAFTVDFTVRARTTLTSDSWEGQPLTARAATVSALGIPVLLRCS